MNAQEAKSHFGWPGRGWLRYSLRALLALVVITALPAWWLRCAVDDLKAEHEAIVQLKKAGADISTAPVEPRWFWNRIPKSLAPHPYSAILVDASRPQTPLAPDHMPLLRRLTSIIQLCINRSSITDADLRFCGAMSKIETLDLSMCPRVTGLALSYFSSAHGLKHIVVPGTAFSDEGVGRLAAFKELESLMLVDTRVTDAAIPSIVALRRLTYLGLPRGVTSLGLRRIGELADLTRLHVWLRRGDDVEALTGICRLPKLKELTVRGDGLTNVGLKVIASAAGLEKITICGGNVDRGGLHELRALPKLKSLGVFTGALELAHGEPDAQRNPWEAWEPFADFRSEMAPIGINFIPSHGD